MNSSFLSLIKIHRRKSALLAALVLYTALGFLFVPWLAQRQISGLLQSRLGLQTEIESLYFNPFSFYAEIDGLSLADGEGNALLSVSHFHIDLQPSRLLLLKIQIADAAFSGVTLKLDRYSDGSTTPSVLAARWQESSAPASSEPTTSTEETSLPAAEVLSLTLSDIELQLNDEVPVTAFSTKFTLDSFTLTNFSTLENTSGQYSLAAQFENGAPLAIDGILSVIPLSSSGAVSVSQFPLPMLTRYLQDSLPLSLSEGEFGQTFDYAVDLSSAEPQVSISNVSSSLQNIMALEKQTNTEFFSLRAFNLRGGEVSIPENTVAFSALTVDGVEVTTDINENGEINFNRMLDQFSTSPSADLEPAPSAVSDEAATPWQVSLAQLALSDLNLVVNDGSLAIPFRMSAQINGTAESISNLSAAAIPYNLSVSVDSGGTLNSTGQIIAIPNFALESDIELNELSLPLVQPYLNELAYVVLQEGTLTLNTSVILNDNEPFAARGGLSLNSLKLRDTARNEDLVNLDSLSIDDFAYSAATNGVEVSEVNIDALYARVVINEDGSTNIGRIIKPAELSSAEEQAIETVPASDSGNSGNAPMSITFGSIRVNNSAANFTDRDLPIVFNANIQGLGGTAEGLASNSQEPAVLALEGQVDDFGLVQIDGSLNPFNPTRSSDINVRFTNIDMPAMTPYVIKFAGREISEGTVDLGLNYRIAENQLTANNQMVLKDLKLGERVESPDAMDLPLDLAIALLKDGNGVIDLEVPITGDVNDPEFDFGPAIRRALTNIITNIVAAPFRLLGNLVAGGDDSLESIRFLPGRSDIAPPEQQILRQLGEALTQRPQLLLEVPPTFTNEDRLALQTAKVNQQIELALEALADDDRLLTQRRRQVLESLYSQIPNAQALAEIEALFLPKPTAEPEQPVPEFDTVAYNAELRQRLIDAAPVSDSELNQLAINRAQAVASFMVESAGIPQQQLKIGEPEQSEVDEEGWLTMGFGLGPAN